MSKKTKARARKSFGKRGVQEKASRRRAVSEEWAAPDEKMFRPLKKPVTLRLDADLLAWFKSQGRGYQTRINRALRGVMEKQR
jgi:uncharacterized protein (DUF4415 family)